MHKDIRKALLDMGLPAINGEITVGARTYKEDTFCADLANKLEGMYYRNNPYCDGDCEEEGRALILMLEELTESFNKWRERHGD